MRWPAAMLAACLSLALPAVADAAIRCVGISGPECDAVYPAIGSDSAAGSAVNAAAVGDTIRIGPGVYTEEVSTAKELHFVGAGAGTLDSFDPASQTRIVGPDGFGGRTALLLRGGGSVASMQTVGGDAMSLDFAGNGLALQGQGSPVSLDYAISDVVAISGTGGYGGNALFAYDPAATINAVVSGGALGNPLGGTAANFISPGGSSSLTGVTVRASGTGVVVGAGTVRIDRSTVSGSIALGVFAGDSSARAEAVDSVFATSALASAEIAGYVATTGAGNSTLIARGSTFVARNSGPSAGIRLLKSSSYTGALSAVLFNTIARTESTDADAYDLDADSGGTISADFSSFTTRRTAAGGTAPAPGSANNVFGDPRFTNSAAGDLTLRADSPLIDRGDPGLVIAGELDAAGNPRSLDGNGDCVARPDIGAFERADACPSVGSPNGPPPNEAPSVTRFAMTNSVFAPVALRAAARPRRPKRGTTFRYTLSEPARITITIDRRLRGRRARYRRAGRLTAQKLAGRRSTRFSGRLRGRPLRPGRYRARIVAVDSLGARSKPRRLLFRMVRP
jgi:hypothetical protein